MLPQLVPLMYVITLIRVTVLSLCSPQKAVHNDLPLPRRVIHATLIDFFTWLDSKHSGSVQEKYNFILFLWADDFFSTKTKMATGNEFVLVTLLSAVGQ